MYRAKEVTDSEQPRLHKLVNEVIHLAGIPKPKVYVMESQMANAFAVGRSPKHSAVAVTTGIMNILNDDELKGVIAHEVSHIKNRDTLIATISATIASVIAYLAMMARWTAIFGGFGGRDRNGGNMLELLVLAILTPLIASLIQLAISRSREFLADESAAKMLHSGLGLASALEKLDEEKGHHSLRHSSQTQTTAHLFILNPFKGKGLLNLFSTHPPIPTRVKKLKDINI